MSPLDAPRDTSHRHEVDDLDAAPVNHPHSHASTTGQGPDDHHNEDHAGRHASGGADAVSPASIGASAEDHTHEIDDLTDVDTTGAADGDALVLDSGVWGPGNPSHDHDDDYLATDLTPDSSPGRSLDTTFQPSATRPVLVSYTIQIAISSNQSAGVELRSDASDPPTTPRDEAWFAQSGGVSVPTLEVFQTIRHLVPAGDHVRLVTSGTATTLEIAHQTETVL